MATRLPNYIRSHRRRGCLSQKELAYLLGRRRGQYISKCELYEAVPDLETALACEVVLGIPVKELFAGVFQEIEERTIERVGLLARKLMRQQDDPMSAHKLDHLARTVRQSTPPYSEDDANPFKRILAIDPSQRGFGFVLLEGDALIDWGLVVVRSQHERGIQERIDGLVARSLPDLVVFENRTGRRGAASERVYKALQAVIQRQNLEAKTVTRRQVRATFSDAAKDEIAAVIAKRFPQLVRLLPRPRKPWKSESANMAIFDAASFAVTALEEANLGTRVETPPGTRHPQCRPHLGNEYQ